MTNQIAVFVTIMRYNIPLIEQRMYLCSLHSEPSTCQASSHYRDSYSRHRNDDEQVLWLKEEEEREREKEGEREGGRDRERGREGERRGNSYDNIIALHTFPQHHNNANMNTHTRALFQYTSIIQRTL